MRAAEHAVALAGPALRVFEDITFLAAGPASERCPARVAEDQARRHAVFALRDDGGADPVVGRRRLQQALDVIEGAVGGRQRRAESRGP